MSSPDSHILQSFTFIVVGEIFTYQFWAKQTKMQKVPVPQAFLSFSGFEFVRGSLTASTVGCIGKTQP